VAIINGTSSPQSRKDAKKSKNKETNKSHEVAIIKGTTSPIINGTTSPPERVNELLERTILFYEKAFKNCAEGKNYLTKKRGIGDVELFSKHRIGYVDGSLLKALPKEGEMIDDLIEIGVLLPRKNGKLKERFLGCLVFPVFDINGYITTLYGRDIAAKRHLYLPGRPVGMFNISIIKSFPSVVLVESCIDALSCELAGI
jgi:DNA primase